MIRKVRTVFRILVKETGQNAEGFWSRESAEAYVAKHFPNLTKNDVIIEPVTRSLPLGMGMERIIIC